MGYKWSAEYASKSTSTTINCAKNVFSRSKLTIFGVFRQCLNMVKIDHEYKVNKIQKVNPFTFFGWFWSFFDIFEHCLKRFKTVNFDQENTFLAQYRSQYTLFLPILVSFFEVAENAGKCVQRPLLCKEVFFRFWLFWVFLGTVKECQEMTYFLGIFWTLAKNTNYLSTWSLKIKFRSQLMA